MSTMQSAKFRFTLQEGQVSSPGAKDGPLSFVLEPIEGDLTILQGGHLSLRLAPGTSLEWAEETLKTLNVHVASVAFTAS